MLPAESYMFICILVILRCAVRQFIQGHSVLEMKRFQLVVEVVRRELRGVRLYVRVLVPTDFTAFADGFSRKLLWSVLFKLT
jgi:hypothetical protein